MSESSNETKSLDRRGFLRGSAFFAAALGLGTVLPAVARAQDAPARPAPAEAEKRKQEEEERKKAEERKPKPLIDADGREYRICDMCGGNMYKQGDTWSCEQCGFSYVE
jgi:anaerobic selenocysteine-containing dehydrogenase